MKKHTGYIVISSFVGVISGTGAYMIISFIDGSSAVWYAILSGTLMFTAIFTLLLISMRRLEKKYDEIEKMLPPGMICKEDVNVATDRGVFGCRLYVGANELILVSWDRKPGIIDVIPKENFLTYEIESFVLVLRTTAGDYRITPRSIEALLVKLAEAGYVRAEQGK